MEENNFLDAYKKYLILKKITEKQIAILDSLDTNERYRTLCGDFEGAERVQCSFEDGRVERNPKQKEAVEFSVGVKDLFLIWGPPGTGKSTLVLEIIRNYLTRNSDAKILICSYANRAVDRIVEIICNDGNLMQKIVRVGPSQHWATIVMDCSRTHCRYILASQSVRRS